MTKKRIVEQAVAQIEDRSTKRQIEAAKLLTNALSGDVRAKMMLQEGISTSDIPTLLEPAINVIFLAQYAEEPVVWDQIADTYETPDFGPIRFGDFQVDPSALKDSMGEEFIEGGLPRVNEYEEYPAIPFVTTELDKEFVNKYGVRARMSWESLRRTGNFDMIGQFTSAFARYAARQEDIVLAKLFVGTDGNVNPAWASKALAGHPAMSLKALEDALKASREQRVNGNRVIAPNYKLIYGTALTSTVANLFSIQTLERTDDNGVYTINASTFTSPYTPIEFPTLDLVSGGQTDDFWFVVPDGGPRPHFWEVFLQGARTPLISIKDSGHFALTGGDVPAREGSFEEDDVQTRVRHLVDAVLVTSDGFVYSDGSNGS